MQSEISNYTCVCSKRWGSSSIHVLQSAYLFKLWLHKMEYSINELQYTVYSILYNIIVTKLQYVTEFWKTYHLHTSEIIRISNFAAL